MDILNFISWIKGGRQVSTVDATKTLIPLGLKDNRRDDGYLAGAITVQDLANQIAPPPPPPPVNPTNQYVPLNYNGEFADSPLGILPPPNGFFGWAGIRTQAGTLAMLPPGATQENSAQYLPYYGLSVISDSVSGTQTSIGDYNTPGRLYLSVIGDYPASPSVANSLYTNPSGFGVNSPFWVKGDGSLVQIGQQFNYSTTNMMNGILADAANGNLKINCNIAGPGQGIISASQVTGLVMMGTVSFRGLGINFAQGAVHVGSGLTNTSPPVDPVNPATWITVMDENGITYKSPLYL